MSDDPVNNAMTQRMRGFGDDKVHPRRAELRRLASEMRSIMELLVSTDAAEEVISDIADDLAAFNARLDHEPRRRPYEGYSESANSGDPHAFFDDSPLLGLSNPLAPPIMLEMHDDHIVGHATFGAPYEGPPGCVHGGYVAAAFDEILGCAQSFSGSPGMTGRLTVNYRSPTPLHTPLRFVGRLERVDGRKIYTTGEVFDGDTLTAEAEGLFISIDFAKFAALRAARETEADG
jgi:acyl-coenzyme A thioesterase PaaI-like protein